jgi:hypothetical protein
MATEATEAPTQDAIAESLLGPEEQQQSAVETPEAEQQQEVVDTQEQPLEQEQQPEQEEVENWLPTEQDKIFPDEVLQRYAQRYGLDESWQANPQLKQLVIDKINSDIYLQQLQQQEQYEPEPEVQQEPTPQTAPQVTREQHFQNLARAVQERTDPEVAKQFHNEFLSIWQRPEAEQPMALAQVTSKYMLNLVNTFLPDMLQAQLSQQLGQAFPGFSDMYDRSSHAMAWDRVRNSDPSFQNLPSYGTKEFSQKLREAASRIPGFDEMQFTDQQGRPLPAQQNAERKYAMLAKIASGQNVNPQLLQQAAAAGARNARRADVRRSAGNLGSGKSNAATGAKGSSRFQTNSDLFDEETMDLYTQEHGRL